MLRAKSSQEIEENGKDMVTLTPINVNSILYLFKTCLSEARTQPLLQSKPDSSQFQQLVDKS